MGSPPPPKEPRMGDLRPLPRKAACLLPQDQAAGHPVCPVAPGPLLPFSGTRDLHGVHAKGARVQRSLCLEGVPPCWGFSLGHLCTVRGHVCSCLGDCSAGTLPPAVCGSAAACQLHRGRPAAPEPAGQGEEGSRRGPGQEPAALQVVGSSPSDSVHGLAVHCALEAGRVGCPLPGPEEEDVYRARAQERVCQEPALPAGGGLGRSLCPQTRFVLGVKVSLPAVPWSLLTCAGRTGVGAGWDPGAAHPCSSAGCGWLPGALQGAAYCPGGWFSWGQGATLSQWGCGVFWVWAGACTEGSCPSRTASSVPWCWARVARRPWAW